MFKTFKKNVLDPMAVRVGTGVSGLLVGYGLTEAHADIVGMAAVAVLGVGIDLMLSWLRRRSIAADARRAALTDPISGERWEGFRKP